jgi:5,10-methenyltetrahydrofolate synthetase
MALFSRVSPLNEPAIQMDTPTDISAWRKERRKALLARREAADRATFERWCAAIDAHLELGFPGLARGTLGFCWPYRGEHDARHVAAHFRARGARTALPVVKQARAPLVFREWHPGVALAPGALGIPFPVDSPEVRPDAVLVPVVGFDDAGYRLGYGGGFFDRTLAAAEAGARPAAIGIAFELCRLPTIHPQPHDVPMDYVVSERGIYRRDGAKLEFLGAPRPGADGGLTSPVCYAGDAERPEFKDGGP